MNNTDESVDKPKQITLNVQNFEARLAAMTILISNANMIIVNEARRISDEMIAKERLRNIEKFFNEADRGRLCGEELKKIIEPEKPGYVGKTKKPFYRKNERW